MAIEKTIDIKVNSEQANRNLKDINNTIDEQKEILVLLEEEYIKAKNALDDYNKSGKRNLAQEKALKDQLKARRSALEDQRLGLKKLAVEQRSANKVVKEFTVGQKETTNIIRGIDKLTGGYATKIVKLKKGFVSGFNAVKTFALGLGSVQKALIATGFGAIIAGLGLVIANFDKIKEFFGVIPEETKEAREKMQKEMEQLNSTIAKQSLELEVLARGYKSGTLQGKQLQKAVDDVNDKFEDANIQLDENNQLTDESLAFIDAQIDAIKKQAKNKAILTKIEALYGEELEATSRIGQKNAALQAEITKQQVIQAKLAAETNLFQKEKLLKEIRSSENRQKAITSDIVSLVNERAGIQREIDQQVSRIETVEKPKKKRKKRKGKSEEDIEAEEALKLADLKDRIRDAEANKEDEARALELQKIKEQNEKLLKEAKDKNLLTEELQTSLDERLLAKQKEFDEIDEKREKAKAAKEKADKEKKQKEKIKELAVEKDIDELTFDEQRKIFNDRLQLLREDKILDDDQKIELKKQFEKSIEEINKKQEEIRKLREQQTLSDASNTFNQVANIAGKDSKIGKAFALAGATISGVQGVQNAYSTAQKSPITAIFPGYPAVQAGLAAAVAAQNIAAIRKVDPSGKGGSSVSSPSAGGAGVSQPPSFNIVGASETNQLAEAIGEQTQQPVQAYVVANDVTTAQSLENNIVEGATLE
jgi:hypothetical protein